jgi:hypothetical protein
VKANRNIFKLGSKMRKKSFARLYYGGFPGPHHLRSRHRCRFDLIVKNTETRNVCLTFGVISPLPLIVAFCLGGPSFTLSNVDLDRNLICLVIVFFPFSLTTFCLIRIIFVPSMVIFVIEQLVHQKICRHPRIKSISSTTAASG